MELEDDGYGALRSFVSNLTKNSYRESGCLNVKELILLLKDVKYPTNNITFEDGSYITTLDSYRGSYSELAIASSVGSATDIETVESFTSRLENMIGETIHGYKGGDYTVTSETTVHKANYGECGDIIVGIEECEGLVLLLTRGEDDEPSEAEKESDVRLVNIKARLEEKRKEEVAENKEVKIGSVVKRFHKAVDTSKLTWDDLVEDDDIRVNLPCMLSIVAALIDIKKLIDYVFELDFNLSSRQFAVTVKETGEALNNLALAFHEFADPSVTEESIFSKELIKYLGSYYATTEHQWDIFENTKNPTRDDVWRVYMFLYIAGTSELLELIQNRMMELWTKGEIGEQFNYLLGKELENGK